ncbi:MAG: CBS domain-containing protein [Alphaproteobacteria bacterium]
MPCHAAIVDKHLVLKEDVKVEKALKAIKKAAAAHAAVTDENGTLVGFFSYAILMKNLLPVSVAMADGIQLDVTIPAAPGIAKRLKNVLPLQLSQFIERKNFPVVYPETPLWEGVNLIVQTGLPLCVIEPESQKYIGLITHESAFDELQRLKDSES